MKNSVTNISSLKIGRTTYNIKKGDYVLFNGACYQLVAGDGRTLRRSGFDTFTNLRIPNTVVKQIPFTEMEKTTHKSLGMVLIKWYF